MSEKDDLPPSAVVESPRARLPLVWIVPLIAVLIGGWLAVRAVLDRGPSVRVQFASAEGLEAGKTKVRYKELEIGQVADVRLAPDHENVIAVLELKPDTESFLRSDTQFWVVRPRIAGGQVTGLSTLLSGSFVGIAPGKHDESRRDFVGLDEQPVAVGKAGRQFVLRAPELRSIDVGVPVFYRRLPVGQVSAYELDADGSGVTVKVFVDAPYDRYVTPRTRFWNASGVDLKLDAEGLRLRTESAVALLVGGIAFEAPGGESIAEPAAADTPYVLHPDRDSAFRVPDTEISRHLMVFEQSARGLQVGAPVDFRGVVLGEVASVGLELDETDLRFRSVVEVDLFPERLRRHIRRGGGKPRYAGRSQEALKLMIERGFRGQLRTGNLLTGQLYVSLDFFPEAKPVAVSRLDYPNEIPTVPGEFEALQRSLPRIVRKIEQIPFDRIGVGLEQAIARADSLIAKLDGQTEPELRTTLEQTRSTLEAARALMAQDAPVQQELRETLREVTRTVEQLRVLADTLERQPESLLRGKREEP